MLIMFTFNNVLLAVTECDSVRVREVVELLLIWCDVVGVKFKDTDDMGHCVTIEQWYNDMHIHIIW